MEGFDQAERTSPPVSAG